MAFSVGRSRETMALPPISHAHLEGLRALIGQLHEHGQDVMLLTQLAESLPRLRSGLSTAERQRIEELDTNENLFLAALNSVREAIDVFDCVVAPPEQVLTPTNNMLIDPMRLRQIAEATCVLAESANDLALRAMNRSELLE
jgi:hypothetical protein